MEQETIVCGPGDDLNARAAAGAPGDVFLLTAGVYKNQKVLPQDGQAFIGEPGTVLDGTGVTDAAFYYDDAVRHPRAVTLRGFTVQHYTGAGGRGAIYGANTRSWVLDQLSILGSTHGRGVDVGPGMIVRSCLIAHNYCEGLSGYQAHGLVIEGCEFANNNTGRSDPDSATGYGSGLKLATCIGARMRQCYAHDNYGAGLWLDIDCHDVQIISCHTQRNSHRGIQIEISDTVLVLDTLCIADGLGMPLPGGGGIFVSSASNVEIAGCQLRSCGGITRYDDPNRGSGPYGPRRLVNFHPHDNQHTDVRIW